MKISNKVERIFWYEAVGFLCSILLSWLNELLSLPQLLFGGGEHYNWRESAIETVVLLVVWLVVFVLTKRLIKKLHYLEGFLRVCAWCKKVCHEDDWMPLEHYFDRRFDIKTSHGMCPVCLERHVKEIEAT